MKIIKNFLPPVNSSPYNPARLVTIPTGESVDVRLQGRESDTFGIDRILPGGQNLSDITATAFLNEEFIIFKDVKLSALRQHFRNRKLLTPFVIQRNNHLNITLTNNAGVDSTVNIELLGYDTPAVSKLISEYEKMGLPMPQPVFLYATQEIPASASTFQVPIPTKAVDVEILRASISTDQDEDITVSIQIYNEIVKNKVFVDQINNEFEQLAAMVPFAVGRNVPLSLQVDNLDNSAHELSFLAEAYITSNGD